VLTAVNVGGEPWQLVSLAVVGAVNTGAVGEGLTVTVNVNTFPIAALVQVLGRTVEESITV
jgi:hypothetical protein